MSKKEQLSTLTEDDLRRINSEAGILELLKSRNYNVEKILKKLRYTETMEYLQEELIKLQNWMIDSDKRVLIIFEGRDAAGKGGTIKRFTDGLMPRYHRVVALSKPSETEKGQWYFQRYISELPTADEIVLFDRSWYNRAVVEPVNGFCTESQYKVFMSQVNDFEKMLINDGIYIFKFWLDISKEEQEKRFNERLTDPLKQWKIGPVDAKAQELWDDYTRYRDLMLKQTDSNHCPWIFVNADSKKKTRVECIKYVLNNLDYTGKSNSKISLKPENELINLYSNL
jgi:polyphosphate kinase 2